ncbi:hypothetical protein N665_0089s0023 [Sinapis alba]|nr:hypothetical protein N665_0089s0023 [Sinapis alba]
MIIFRSTDDGISRSFSHSNLNLELAKQGFDYKTFEENESLLRVRQEDHVKKKEALGERRDQLLNGFKSIN